MVTSRKLMWFKDYLCHLLHVVFDVTDLCFSFILLASLSIKYEHNYLKAHDTSHFPS